MYCLHTVQVMGAQVRALHREFKAHCDVMGIDLPGADKAFKSSTFGASDTVAEDTQAAGGSQKESGASDRAHAAHTDCA